MMRFSLWRHLRTWMMSPLLCCFLMSVHSYAVVGSFSFSNPEQEARYHQLTLELRCPKCQNQSIADSDALVAQDLRRAVYQQVESGKSDQQVIDFMVQRYGDFILYRPPVNKVTWLLWFGPALMLLVGLLIIWRLIRSYRKFPLGDDSEVSE